MGQPSLLWEAAATVIFNFFLTGVTAAAALVQPFLPGADQVALVLALVMVSAVSPQLEPLARRADARRSPLLLRGYSPCSRSRSPARSSTPRWRSLRWCRAT